MQIEVKIKEPNVIYFKGILSVTSVAVGLKLEFWLMNFFGVFVMYEYESGKRIACSSEI